jgi:hypothetical protein
MPAEKWLARGTLKDEVMNAKEKGALISVEGERPAPWRSSLYQEPTWVSLAWLVGPALFAAVAIYFTLK